MIIYSQVCCALAGMVVLYVIYTRFMLFILKINYWKRQKVYIPCGFYPIVGHLLSIKNAFKHKQQLFDWCLNQIQIQTQNQNYEAALVLMGNKDVLTILSPCLAQSVFTSKSIDKSNSNLDLFGIIVPQGVGLIPTNEEWLAKRRIMVKSLHNSKKLENIIKMVQNVSQEHLAQYNKFEGDIVSFLTQITQNVITMFVFGILSRATIPYKKDDQIKQLSIGDHIHHTLQDALNIYTEPKYMIFPEIIGIIDTKKSKELRVNANLFSQQINRLAMQELASTNQCFFSKLQSHQEYQNVDNLINECKGVILGGTETISISISNLFFYLSQNQKSLNKVLEEIEHIDLNNGLTIEIVEKCEYTLWSFQEALRLNQVESLELQAQQPCSLKGAYQTYDVPINQVIKVSLPALHRTPSQWQAPLSFIPERFDTNSSYYLTPDGKKRHNFSFIPFIAGRRICAGQRFAEIEAVCIIIMILKQFKIEYTGEQCDISPLYASDVVKLPFKLKRIKNGINYRSLRVEGINPSKL